MAEPSENELRRYAESLQLAAVAKLALSRTPEEQRGDAFADDVRAILDSRIEGRRRLPFGPLRRLRRIIGPDALRSTLEASDRYSITERPCAPNASKRRAKAIELMLAERFVRMVLSLTDDSGNRATALNEAQDDMNAFVQLFAGDPDVDLRKWAPVELRGLQRRFVAMTGLIRERHGYLPNRTLATIPELPPRYSVEQTSAKRGRKSVTKAAE